MNQQQAAPPNTPNAQLSAARIAEAKARSAVEFRRPTKALEDAVAGGVGLRVLTFGASVAEGGVPIVAGGRIVGGIGVSGVASHQDAGRRRRIQAGITVSLAQARAACP